MDGQKRKMMLKRSVPARSSYAGGNDASIAFTAAFSPWQKLLMSSSMPWSVVAAASRAPMGAPAFPCTKSSMPSTWSIVAARRRSPTMRAATFSACQGGGSGGHSADSTHAGKRRAKRILAHLSRLDAEEEAQGREGDV